MPKRIVILMLVFVCCGLATAHSATKKATVSNSSSEWVVEIRRYWLGEEKGVVYPLKNPIILRPGDHHIFTTTKAAAKDISLDVWVWNSKNRRSLVPHIFTTEKWENIDFFDGLFNGWARHRAIEDGFFCCPLEEKLWVENRTSWDATVRILEGYTVSTSSSLVKEVKIEGRHERNRGGSDYYLFIPQPSGLTYGWSVEIVFSKKGRKDIVQHFPSKPRVIAFTSDELVERGYWTFWRKAVTAPE